MTTANEILFRRTGTVLAAADRGKSLRKAGAIIKPDRSVVATGVAELAHLGYRPSPELLDVLMNDQYKFGQVVKTVTEAVKAHKRYTPKYPNFPRQVAEASDVELYVNAMVHYYGHAIGLRVMPVYETEQREPIELGELKEIGLATEADLVAVFTNLVGSKISWGTTDQDDVQWFLDSGRALVWPDVIPNKENLAFLATHCNAEDVIYRAATATDILRIAVVLSGGDPSLSGIGVKTVQFKSFSRPVRRAMLSRLQDFNFDSMVEDMLRNREIWKRLLHGLHAGAQTKLPNVARAAEIIRNNGKGFETFNSKVEKAIAAGKIASAAYLLSSRPGDFARRLDKLVRDSDRVSLRDTVMAAFKQVAEKVSTPVLWQLSDHFANRGLYEAPAPVLKRSYTAKGRSAVSHKIDAPLKPLDRKTASDVAQTVFGAIEDAYAKEPKFDGSVFIDQKLYDLTVPFGMRSANSALVPVGRGTRVDLPDDPTLRFFIWWRDREAGSWAGSMWGSHGTDIDLSAVAFDSDLQNAQDVAFYNLRDEWAVHSGDITSAPNGAAEFIDIDRAKAKKRGIRYIAMTIHVYSGEGFDTLPEVYGGTMGRSKPQSGEIFEPSTVKDAFDVTAPGTTAMPLIIDLEDNKMIWADYTIGRSSAYGTAYGSRHALADTIEGIVYPSRVSYGDVFATHVRASGQKFAEDEESADFVLTTERGRVYLNGKALSQDDFTANWL